MDFKTLVGSVTIATTGLTTCNNTGGAVDPPPPPFECLDGSTQKPLYVVGSQVQGNTLVVQVAYGRGGSWTGAPAVDGVTGGTLAGVTVPQDAAYQIEVRITLAAPNASGSFTVHATATDGHLSCPVQQTFAFSFPEGGPVQVSELDDALPLRVRTPAAIKLTRRDGAEVDLAPGGAREGSRVTWTATAGHVEVRGDGAATWRLPREPGLYQIELLVDRGDDGLALDTLVLEVT